MSRSPHITRRQLDALAELLEPLYLEKLDIRIRQSQTEGAIDVLALDRSGRDYVRIMRDGLVIRPEPFTRGPYAR